MWPGLSGGYIFDDYPVFADNPVVDIKTWHWEAWKALWFWSHTSIQRPIPMFSFAFNYALSGETWGFKVTNLAIHLLNAILVYQLGRKLLTMGWRKENSNHGPFNVDYWAMGAALIWAIHPLQVSAVMYVVQRMEMLGFTFVLLALLAYWRARQSQVAGQRAWPWLILSATLTLVGYYAKETVVLVPGYALLLELTVLRFAAARTTTTRKWKLFYALSCLAATALFLGYLLPHYATPEAYSSRSYTAWQRELTQLRVLPMYIGWCLLPLPSQLHFYYDNYIASTGLLNPISTLFGGLLLLCLLLLAITLRHRRPVLALGIGWFLMAHLLTSSPIPLELVFEHRNYPAIFGLTLATTDILWLASRHLDRRSPAILAAVLVLTLGFLTAIRAATWGNPLLLAQSLANSNPGSPRAALDLARRYVEMSGDNPNMPVYSLGIQQLERAAKLPGSSILPENALLIQAANHPGLDSRPWWESLKRKLHTQPMGPETHLALSGLLNAMLYRHVPIDAQQLADAFEIAITREPRQISLRTEYADLASLALHNPELAIKQWGQTLVLQINSPGYAIRVTAYLVQNHRDQEALGVIAEAQNIEPQLRGNATLESLRKQAQRGQDNGANAIPKG
jgi:hypothetical protein